MCQQIKKAFFSKYLECRKSFFYSKMIHNFHISRDLVYRLSKIFIILVDKYITEMNKDFVER